VCVALCSLGALGHRVPARQKVLCVYVCMFVRERYEGGVEKYICCKRPSKVQGVALCCSVLQCVAV